jgi:hypothetical protein
MINIHKKNKFISDLLSHSYIATKINVYFAQKQIGEDFDSEEQNYTYTNLNSHTIRGYVREVDSTKLIYKQYGLSEQGLVEILVEDKYEDYFRNCNRIVIDSKDYSIFREATGKRALITKRPFRLLRVVLRKNE